MSYKIEKPYSDKERMDFIVKYNHYMGMIIKKTDTAIYALEDWETLDGDTVLDNSYAWRQEKELQEKERIASLKLSKREVFLALYNALGVKPEQIKSLIKDDAALIEFEYANEYYRGNPLIDSVGSLLGITTRQLDRFFETRDYTFLLPTQVEVDLGGDRNE